MKEIKLTQGKVALVDDEDYELLNSMKWCVGRNYAVRKNKRKYESMHQVIMKCPIELCIDHVDGNGLNNQRLNLRLATTKQNTSNRKLNKNSKTEYKGVSEVVSGFRCYIHKDGKQHVIGTYNTRIQAAIMYNIHAKIMYGDFCNLNRISTGDIDKIKNKVMGRIKILENEILMLKKVVEYKHVIKHSLSKQPDK